MTNIFNNNSNPSGYDERYCISYFSKNNSAVNSERDLIKAEIEKETENIKKYIQQNADEHTIQNVNELADNSVQKLTGKYSEQPAIQLSDISLLKIGFILKIIKRKLAVLHRVSGHRLLKGKIIPDSVIIEREIEKRATLNIVDMLAILKSADKDKTMSTQQKVVLMNELNKNVKLTVDEKITIVDRIISSDIVADVDSQKHLANKLVLLYIVKASGFSIDVTRVKGYKPVMNEVEETNSNNNQQPSEEELVNELTQDDNSTENTTDIDLAQAEQTELEQIKDNQENTNISVKLKLTQKLTTAKSKSNRNKSEKAQKAPATKPNITKTFVNSKRHFKFGAGYIAKNKTLSILLPSGYILDENRAYQSDSLRNYNKQAVGFNYNASGSPLCITFTKSDKTAEYSLLDFYNSNIIECKNNGLKYRNTVISKSPAVLKHKSGVNVYTASVFLRKTKCVYDIKFEFKKTVANTASTVNRILASIKFEGM